MGANSAIAWTHHTFNAWIGCARVSPGCENCYAESLATKRMKLPVWGVDSPRKELSESYWRQPHAWNRKATKLGERHRVFCSSLADIFETPPERNQQAIDVQGAARERLWKLIAETPALDWLLLTKRPENISKLVPWRMLVAEGRYNDRPAWPSNVWIGTTVEDQKRSEERIPWLLEVPAAVRFVSCEPLLEPIDLENVTPYYLRRDGSKFDPVVRIDALRGHVKGPDDMLEWRVDWVICGGESGPAARPFNPTWAKDIISRCRSSKTAVFMKQLGSNVLDFGGAITDRKGGDPNEWPAELRVQEFPKTEAA